MSTFKDILSDLMTCHDLSQRELAAEIGTSNATISRLVTGKSEYPDTKTLISLADFFGVSTDYLLGREQ